MSQRGGRPAGPVEPCLPSSAKAPPPGPGWLHEIKHDGFRIPALRGAAGMQLVTRNGNGLTARFPLIVAAMAALPARFSCLIDGEVIVGDGAGLAVFDLLWSWGHDLPRLHVRPTHLGWAMGGLLDCSLSRAMTPERTRQYHDSTTRG